MKIYSLLFIAFLFQEPISSNVILLEAYQYHYNIWIIHLLFIVATALDSICLYYFGAYIHKKFSQSNAVLYAKRKSQSFLSFAGKNGTRIALFLYGPIIFPISAFIAPWIEVSFWDSFIFLFLGDLVFWYGSEWLLVLGVKSFIPNPHLALLGMFIVSVLFTVGLRFFSKRYRKLDRL
jgi:membrane protein YqaA with SNARE-associated domain